ncbi:GNAT family N-acetyltransferase [Lewinella sp. LCG006]|uniref:GNAT family N-acetyltransferase n=1 Tax=Lewinella sp. LCG006 TaxID=3231911 RepID=UPI00345F63DB
MSTPILRPIQAADNAQVAKIIRQVMTEFSCVGPGFSIEDPEVDHMYEAYQGDKAAFFVVEHQGQVLGCGGFGPLSGGDGATCELKKMYFLSEIRGHGMGKKLLNHCIEAATQKGYQRMYLETVNRMTSANALYRLRGFQQLQGAEGATGHSSCDTFYALALV